MKDYYKILNVNAGASQDEIQKQYQFLANAYHPDKFSDPEQKANAENIFKDINEAYEVLGNSTNRERYDSELLTLAGEKKAPQEVTSIHKVGRTSEKGVEGLTDLTNQEPSTSQQPGWFQSAKEWLLPIVAVVVIGIVIFLIMQTGGKPTAGGLQPYASATSKLSAPTNQVAAAGDSNANCTVVDGYEAALFIAEVKGALESPGLLMVDLV